MENRPVLSQSISRVTDKSFEIVPASLFIAIKGLKNDGHHYLAEAKTRGACMAIVERQVDIDLPQIVVSDSKKALATLSSAFFGHPAKKLKLIGVTGTNGKTTTTHIIHHILNPTIPTGLVGSQNIKIGANDFDYSSFTTPEAPKLHYYFQKMREAHVSWVALEVSSHGISQKRTSGLQFEIAAITNISPDHLDFHNSLENYIETKAAIFSQVKPDGFAFFNGDDKFALELLHQVKHPNKFTIGQSPNCDFILTYKDQNSILITGRNSLFPNKIELSNLLIWGKHNLYNAALASLIALYSGISKDNVIERVKTFSGVRRRLETIFKQEFTIIDDYAHNPGGITSTIQTIAKLKPKRLLIVFSIRGNRGVAINRENSKALVNNLSKKAFPILLWLTSSDDVVTPKDKVNVQEKEAVLSILKNSGITTAFEPTLHRALEAAIAEAKPGDLILLLGAQTMDPAQRILGTLLKTKSQSEVVFSN